jgi:cytochrome c
MKKILAILPLLALTLAFRSAPVSCDPTVPADIQVLLEKNGCNACHSMTKKLVGPKWTDIAAKNYSAKKIATLVKKPEPSNWPTYPPMTAQPNVPKKELEKIANWLASVK